MARVAERPRFTPRPGGPPPNFERFGRVLAVMSGKGGVGKSSVALNLAVALNAAGHRVGLADLDVTNPNLPTMVALSDFRFEPAKGLVPPEVAGVPVASTAFFSPPGKALVWRGPMKQKMIVQLLQRVAWPELDILVLDLPPGTSDEPLSVAEMLRDRASAVLVTTPQRVSTEDLERSYAFTQQARLPLSGVIENMSRFVCDECGKEHALFGRGGGKATAERLGAPFLGEVPFDVAMVTSGDRGKPFVLAHPDAPAAQALTRIAKLLGASGSAEAQNS